MPVSQSIRPVTDPLYWIERENPTVFAVARAIVRGSGSNPDRTVPFEGPAPIWTDHIREAKAAMQATAIMLRASGFVAAARFLDGEAGAEALRAASAYSEPRPAPLARPDERSAGRSLWGQTRHG